MIEQNNLERLPHRKISWTIRWSASMVLVDICSQTTSTYPVDNDNRNNDICKMFCGFTNYYLMELPIVSIGQSYWISTKSITNLTVQYFQQVTQSDFTLTELPVEILEENQTE